MGVDYNTQAKLVHELHNTLQDLDKHSKVCFSHKGTLWITIFSIKVCLTHDDLSVWLKCCATLICSQSNNIQIVHTII